MHQQMHLPFPDDEPPLSRFDRHHNAHPEIFTAFQSVLSEVPTLNGVSDIHAVYWFAKVRAGVHVERSWLPAYARRLEAEGVGVRFAKRHCRFDPLPPL